MSNSAWTPLMGMLVMQLPLILVYAVGMLIALVRLQRNSRPATFVLVACVLLLASSLISPLAQTWAINNRSGSSVASIGQVLTVVNLVLGLVRAAAFVLLLFAAFVGRKDPDAVYAAFPVGQANPAAGPPPPVAQRLG